MEANQIKELRKEIFRLNMENKRLKEISDYNHKSFDDYLKALAGACIENYQLKEGLKQIIDLYESDMTDLQIVRRMNKIASELITK